MPDTDNYDDLSTALPYKAVANDVIISENPDILTAIIEMHVSAKDGIDVMQNRHDRVMKLILDFPSDITVSFYYCKIFENPNIPVFGKHKNNIVNHLEKLRCAHISKLKSPMYSCYTAISLPVEGGHSNGNLNPIRAASQWINENFFKRKAESLKSVENHLLRNDNSENYKKALDRINTVIKTFIASIDGAIFRLNSHQIIQFLSLLINHQFISEFASVASIFKSDFISSIGKLGNQNTPGYVYYGGHYHAVLSLRNIGKDSRLPDYTHAGLNTVFSHYDLKDVPFTVHHSIHMPEKSKGVYKAKVRKNMMMGRAGFAKYLPWLAKTPEGIEPDKLRNRIDQSIEIVQNSNSKFLDQHFHVHLWAASIKELDEVVSHFNATISSTYKLKREKLNIKSAYFSVFPGNEAVNPIKSTLPSFNVCDFMPIDMPRFLYPHKKRDYIYFHNEEGSLIRLSPFDGRADNFNSLVVGSSGSGKSFLEQEKLWQYMVYNPMVAIIDYGGQEAGSYRNFVLNNGGTYLEIGFKNDAEDFSVNPFDGPFFDETDDTFRRIPEKLTSLLATIERMLVKSEDDILKGDVEYELQNQIAQYYKDKNNNKGDTCNLNEFAEVYLKGNKALLSAGRDLYKELYPFIGEGDKEGPYARFFKRTKETRSKDLICFDLEGLKGHVRLKNVIVAALIDLITDKILNSGDYTRQKLLVMDEAWKDLKGGDMTDFMENCARKIRKLRGSISIISQRFGDILESPIGNALLANTSYFYFIGSKHAPKEIRKAEANSSIGSVRLSEYDIETIVNCKSKRDFYLLAPFFSGLLRFFPFDEFRMVATTDPEEKEILQKHMAKCGVQFVTPEVMDSAKHDFLNR